MEPHSGRAVSGARALGQPATVKSGKFGPSKEPRLIRARVLAIDASETKTKAEFYGFSMGCASSPRSKPLKILDSLIVTFCTSGTTTPSTIGRAEGQQSAGAVRFGASLGVGLSDAIG